MDIKYTLHAEEQVNDRKIEKVWIEETIRHQHKTERDGNKYYVVRKLNGRTLKVIYVKEKYIKVITIFFIQ